MILRATLMTLVGCPYSTWSRRGVDVRRLGSDIHAQFYETMGFGILRGSCERFQQFTDTLRIFAFFGNVLNGEFKNVFPRSWPGGPFNMGYGWRDEVTLKRSSSTRELLGVKTSPKQSHSRLLTSESSEREARMVTLIIRQQTQTTLRRERLPPLIVTAFSLAVPLQREM